MHPNWRYDIYEVVQVRSRDVKPIADLSLGTKVSSTCSAPPTMERWVRPRACNIADHRAGQRLAQCGQDQNSSSHCSPAPRPRPSDYRQGAGQHFELV